MKTQKKIFIGYIPFGNYPYAIINDSFLADVLSARYERTLQILEKHPSAKMTLALTGQTKELVAREFLRTYKSILEYTANGRLELTQCPYTHPQPALTPYASIIEHMERDIEVTRKFYGEPSTVFWSPESTWSPYLPLIMKKFGATSVYLRQLPVEHPLFLNGINNSKVIGFNLGLRPRWTPETSLDKIRQDFEEVIEKVEKSKYDYGFMLLFGDDLEMSGMEEEALLHERILQVAENLNYVEPILIGDFFSKHPPEEEMEYPQPTSWINHFRWWSGDIVDIHQNSLAEGVRRSLDRSRGIIKQLPLDLRNELIKIERKIVDELVNLESTEPKGWKPTVDRRLWGYRHAAKGIALCNYLEDKTSKFVIVEKESKKRQYLLVESAGLERKSEHVEIILDDDVRTPKEVEVKIDGSKIESQTTFIENPRMDSGKQQVVVFNSDAKPDFFKIAEIETYSKRKPDSYISKIERVDYVELTSCDSTVMINLKRGGRIEHVIRSGNNILLDEEYLNAIYFTPTRTFERLSDDSRIEQIEKQDGPVFSQIRFTQILPLEIHKHQMIRLYKSSSLILVETELIFNNPESLGVYQPWKQNKSDKSLIVGDICIKNGGCICTTLPLSPDVIYRGNLPEDGIPRYQILANNWACISQPEYNRSIGIIADGSICKFDIARIINRDGWFRLGYDGGSPSQYGPMYNDERHGFWQSSHRFRLYYIVKESVDIEEIQRGAIKITRPLYSSLSLF